jgi:hypothetical protein
LPPGLYFSDNGACGGNACLTIQPDIQWDLTVLGNEFDPDAPNTAYIKNLAIAPGLVTPADPLNPSPGSLLPLDFNAAAAYVLYQAINNGEPLANIVSLIRAGASAGGLASTNASQAKAYGAATLKVPNGTTQTVTAELTLPPGLYFKGSQNSACPSGQACFVVLPSFTNRYDGSNPSNGANLVAIASLTLDPGLPEATNPAAGYALSQYSDLSDQVSIIRAGAGSDGLE